MKYEHREILTYTLASVILFLSFWWVDSMLTAIEVTVVWLALSSWSVMFTIREHRKYYPKEKE